MKKIVINKCFGGFGLSDEGFELYLEKKKIKFYKYPSNFSIGGSLYYRVPKEKYEREEEIHCKKDGDYRWINKKGWYLSYRELKRDDKILVEVVEELGEDANGSCADLKIVSIPDGVDFEIDEYDGLETIDEVHKSWG